MHHIHKLTTIAVATMWLPCKASAHFDLVAHGPMATGHAHAGGAADHFVAIAFVGILAAMIFAGIMWSIVAARSTDTAGRRRSSRGLVAAFTPRIRRGRSSERSSP